MIFYKDCLRAELNLQTVGESPLADKMPGQMRDCTLHATLLKEGLVIMGPDMITDTGLVKRNAFSLMLNCSSEEEIKMNYAYLSEDGEATHPLEDTFWGAFVWRPYR